MYLLHNLDFRGHAYPIPPHFNHIGDDLSRGLLMFGESSPLANKACGASILVILLHRTIMPDSLEGGYIKIEGGSLHTTFVSVS